MAYMTIEQFRQIYDEWQQSGLSVQQYCENTGIRESRFYYWKAKLREQRYCDKFGVEVVRSLEHTETLHAFPPCFLFSLQKCHTCNSR